MTTSDKVPKTACTFLATEFAISETNGEDARTAPFRMVARSGRPIDHPYWGRVVHDTKGWFVGDRGRIPIDYCHTSDVIGFANHFEQNEHGDLVVSGTLTPGKMDNDRALDVIHKARLGIPWEASINFGGTGIEIERVAEGESTQVNGYTFEGPGTVIKKWPLRGVAVVPYGADQFTSTEFSQGDVSVAVSSHKEDDMSRKTLEELERAVFEPNHENELEQTAATVEADEAVEAEADSHTEESEEEEEVAAAAETSESDVESELSQRKALGRRFKELFGAERGAAYFVDGLSLEEAHCQHAKDLTEENQQLKQQLSTAQFGGEAAPLSAGAKTVKKKKPLALEDPI